MNAFKIRRAETKDVFQINNIINHYITNSTAILDYEPFDMEYRLKWFSERENIHPVIIGELKDEVVAYACLSKLYDKVGYRHSGEMSLYVKHGFEGKGFGTKLALVLFDEASLGGVITTVISKVTAGNDASAALHCKLGFQNAGRLEKVAVKFGKILDVDIYQKFL